jgi:hypothetical protein
MTNEMVHHASGHDPEPPGLQTINGDDKTCEIARM